MLERISRTDDHKGLYEFLRQEKEFHVKHELKFYRVYDKVAAAKLSSKKNELDFYPLVVATNNSTDALENILDNIRNDGKFDLEEDFAKGILISYDLLTFEKNIATITALVVNSSTYEITIDNFIFKLMNYLNLEEKNIQSIEEKNAGLRNLRASDLRFTWKKDRDLKLDQFGIRTFEIIVKYD